jgi:ResB-like family
MLLDRVISFFTSLRLTVVCLGLGMVLIFVGTLAQVDLGLYNAQNEFFRSFFIYWGPKGASWKIPVLPGGYLLGSLLLINLIAAHIKRFSLSKKKIGIFMIHAGLILLLLGQLLTDALSRESAMHLRVGESLNYSVEGRRSELAVIDTSERDSDKVVAIPDSMLTSGKVIHHPDLPFDIRVDKFYANSLLATNQEARYEPSPATRGAGTGLWLRGVPRETSMELQDFPTAAIELAGAQGASGTWLASYYLKPQGFGCGDHTYQLVLRPRRLYKPYTLKLLNFNHSSYKGTDTPKDFSSVVRLERPDISEAREVRIYMNNPLRYNGETFYQQSYDPDDRGSLLEVVHNPSWLTPYVSCVLVGLGMAVQFLMHLVSFARKRIAA